MCKQLLNLLVYLFSPSIRAASEKLAALKSTEKKVEPTVKTSDLSSQILPSASSEVLEAQRKRFEELKVSLQSVKYCVV